MNAYNERLNEKSKEEFLKSCEKEGYTVLGNYINSYTKVLVRCGHSHTFGITPTKFKSGRRCAKCSNRCTEEAKKKFDDLVKYDRYTALTDYKNSKTKVLVRCNWCGKEFFALPSKLYNHKHGCPQCGGTDRETAREDFYRKLMFNNIQPLTDYTNMRTKVTVLHEDCGTTWNIRPNKFMYENIGWCPSCKKAASKSKKVSQFD